MGAGGAGGGERPCWMPYIVFVWDPYTVTIWAPLTYFQAGITKTHVLLGSVTLPPYYEAPFIECHLM